MPLTGSACSTPKPLTIPKPLHSQLGYAEKHEQITTQPWSHRQTKDLLAVKLVTLARVYYLPAGPRLAEALDSSTVVPPTGSDRSAPKPLTIANLLHYQHLSDDQHEDNVNKPLNKTRLAKFASMFVNPARV